MTPTAADLAAITVFDQLPAPVLDWLVAQGEILDFEPGETIMEPGAAADHLFGVVRGGAQFYSLRTGQREPLFRAEAGSVSGVLPYSRLRVGQALVVAVGPTRLYRLPRTRFAALEQVSPDLIQRLVAVMSDRAREEVRTQERDDKLRALGKLSAGLAHELNNPAAAIARAAQALAQRSAGAGTCWQALAQHCPSPEAVAALAVLAQAPHPAGPTRPALAVSAAEDELTDFLEDQGIAQAHRLAPGLVEAGLSADALAPALAQLPAPARGPALAWLENQAATAQLVRDVQDASARISKLVADVKTYSHMDRDGGRAPLDVAAGLDSTLNMLGFALREKQVRVERDYAPGLPAVHGQVSSLNQVWTNLIDNAVDALPAQGGVLTLRTRTQDGFVQVIVADNGSGIPPEVLPHIFEPFYTTKQAGDGSGLGLDIAQRIIRQHDGRLEVSSQPGRTEFCAWLPAMV